MKFILANGYVIHLSVIVYCFTIMLGIAGTASAEESSNSNSEQTEADTTDRTWSKEELSRKVTDFGVASDHGRAWISVKGLFTSLTSESSRKSQLRDLGTLDSSKTKSSYHDQLALSGESDVSAVGTANQQKINECLRSESQNVLTEELVNKNQYLQPLRDGLKLNLDLGSLFGSSAPQRANNVRYGLVVKEIIIEHQGKSFAANTQIQPQELQYAAKSRVVWGIGPISDQFEPTRVPLNQQPHTGQGQSFLSRFRMPSTKFKAQLQPEFDVREGKTPGTNFRIAQENDLYGFTYRTLPGQAETITSHRFRVPVAGGLALGRSVTYSGTGEKTTTSVYYSNQSRTAPISAMVDYNNELGSYAIGVQSAVAGGQINMRLALPQPDDTIDQTFEETTEYSISYDHNF